MTNILEGSFAFQTIRTKETLIGFLSIYNKEKFHKSRIDMGEMLKHVLTRGAS
jgi:hypothetical protein